MQIHIARNGQPMGPFSLEEVNRQLAAGTLNLSDQAWYEGAAGWAPLSSVPGVGSGARRQHPLQPTAGGPDNPERARCDGPRGGRPCDRSSSSISSD